MASDSESEPGTKRKRCEYVENVSIKLKKHLEQAELNILNTLEYHLYDVRRDLMMIAEPKEKIERPANALDVAQIDWSDFTGPDYISGSFFTRADITDPVDGEGMEAKDFLEACLMRYRKDYAETMDLWQKHGVTVERENKLIHHKNSSVKKSYETLQRLPHPSILEVRYHLDLTRLKYGDHLFLEDEYNAEAYFVYTKDEKLFLSRYTGYKGRQLPTEAWPAVNRYHTETLLKDHKCDFIPVHH